MQSRLLAADFSALEKDAHWLKGTAGTLGLQPFTPLAEALEKSAKARNVRQATIELGQAMAFFRSIEIPKHPRGDVCNDYDG